MSVVENNPDGTPVDPPGPTIKQRVLERVPELEHLSDQLSAVFASVAEGKDLTVKDVKKILMIQAGQIGHLQQIVGYMVEALGKAGL